MKDLKYLFIRTNIRWLTIKKEIADSNGEELMREMLYSSYQGVKRFFVLAYDNASGNNQVSVDSFKNYFLPSVKFENYNIKIDVRKFYDQPINDSIKKYDKSEKYQQGRVTINNRLFIGFCLFWKKLQTNRSWFK